MMHKSKSARKTEDVRSLKTIIRFSQDFNKLITVVFVQR